MRAMKRDLRSHFEKRYFNVIVRLLFSLIFVISLTSIILAQGGARIFGTVTELGSNESLLGANVIIKGTSIGTAVDINGLYAIPNVRPGSYTIEVTYIGFKTISRDVTILANQRTLEVNFQMEWQGVIGDDLVITAQARGQMAAINQQRTSNTITNIVSSDRIQELPDVNAAESIGRLPGVAIQRSGGEANKIAIRGLSPKFNTVTVNGVRMPSVDTQDRSVDLSLVSSNMLDGIEVTKALTPDKDADAIGGTVDLRLRTAPENLFADIQLSGGYTALQGTTGNYKIVGSSGRRFFDNTIGLILGFNIDSFDRSADQFSGGYELIPNPQNGNILTPNVTSLNLRENALTRNRMGGNALIDYTFWRGKVVWNTFYNYLGNDGSTRTNELNIGSNQHKYSFSQYKGDASIFTSSLNLEQNFERFQIDFGASYTSSLNRHPNDYYWDFMEESAYNGADLGLIRFAPPASIPPVFKNNIDNTYFNYLNITNRETTENEMGFQGNVKIPITVTSQINGYLKMGGKYRRLDRSHDQEEIGRGMYYGGDQEVRNIVAQSLPDLGLQTGMNRFPLTFFQDNYTRDNFLNGEYPIGYTLNGTILRQITDVTKPYFNYIGQGSLSNDYTGMEEYSAAYAMAEFNLGSYIIFMPGLRYETESTKYSAKFALGTEDRPLGVNGLPTTVAYRDTTTIRSNQHLLPMVHLQIKPLEWVNLRLAYTHTLARPTFRQFAPITYVSRFRDWLTAPNTQLKTSTAVNYDASLSIYRNKLGFFTVSAFYKEISGLIWGVNFPLLAGQTILPEINIPNLTGVPRVGTSLNNDYLATVKGIEFDWQTSFWYLPSFMKGLVLNLNFTVLESETKYPQFSRKSIAIEPRPARPPFTRDVIVDTFRVGRMPDQPSSIANITLGYDYKGFSIRASYLYQSDILRSLATNPENDQFTEDYYRFDLSVKQKLPYNVQVFGNFNNLNNRADRNYQSSIGNYPTFIEYYGFTMDLGIRYQFK
jgi:TonB-dependent receptor